MRWLGMTMLSLLMAGGVMAVQGQPDSRGAAVHDYIGIYRKYLSSLKDTKCPMYPTCSHYGMMVFSDHSFPVAMMMTADRLLRCGGHLDFYPTIETEPHGGRKLDYPEGRPIPTFLTTPAPHTVAAETIHPTDSITKAIQFTQSLINQHCYASALLEIDRLLYEDTAFLRIPVFYLNKLRCFEGLQQYSDGLLFYEQHTPSGIKSTYKIMYTAAHLYDLVGNPIKSIDLYRRSAQIWDSNEAHPYGELAILYAKESLYDEAQAALKHKYTIDSNKNAFAASTAALGRLEEAKYKNPTTAMLLGIIPGAGYLYTEQPRNALVSLLVNGVLAYAVYTSFKTENYGLGIIVGAFSISFYGGNIVGSGTSAQRYNKKIKQDALVELRKQIPFFY